MDLQPKQFVQRPLPGIEGTTHVSGPGGGPIGVGIAPGDRREYNGQVEFQTRQNLRNGGQSTTWESQYSLGRYGSRNAPQPTGPSAREAELGSGQRAMFMSPREIHARYQPLDGDRESPGMPDSWASTGGALRDKYGDLVEADEELWDRKTFEAQMSADDYAERRGEKATGTGTFVDRLDPTTNYPSYRTGHTETFDERAESYVGRKVDEFRERRDRSLYDSIAEEGVRSPIRLGEAKGLMGKPMIVGGHHRLAAQTDLDENRLMPVLHHKDIREAQDDKKVNKAYPYS